MYGYQAFFWALVSVIYLPMWLSNPVLWIGCGYCVDGRWKAERIWGLLAILRSISEVWFWDDPPESGYYVWVSSMVLLAAAGAILIFRADFVERIQRVTAGGRNPKAIDASQPDHVDRPDLGRSLARLVLGRPASALKEAGHPVAISLTVGHRVLVSQA